MTTTYEVHYNELDGQAESYQSYVDAEKAALLVRSTSALIVQIKTVWPSHNSEVRNPTMVSVVYPKSGHIVKF